MTTNSERIKNMSIDEMAEIIMCPYDGINELCPKDSNCIGCCREYLQSEATV